MGDSTHRPTKSFVRLDGVSISPTQRQGAAPGGVLRFTADVGIEVEEIEFTVVEHHLRPMAVLPGQLFERGDSLIPNVATGSDRVIQRTVLRVTVEEPEVVGDAAGAR